MTAGHASRRNGAGRRHLVAVLGVLGSFSVLRSTVLPDGWHFVANVSFALAVVGAALAGGYSYRMLGLDWRRAGAGLRWGVAAAAVVLAVLAAGAALGSTRGWFDNPQADIGGGELALRTLWTIPVGTAAVEELLFRSVLLTVAVATLSWRRGLLVSAVAFGLWHVAPIVGDGALTVVGTVAATTVAGVCFALLHRRADSVVAPFVAHVATNSGALTVAWIVGRS